jgi:hypothetical protein
MQWPVLLIVSTKFYGGLITLAEEPEVRVSVDLFLGSGEHPDVHQDLDKA